jgi:hypothetical protein
MHDKIYINNNYVHSNVTQTTPPIHGTLMDQNTKSDME